VKVARSSLATAAPGGRVVPLCIRVWGHLWDLGGDVARFCLGNVPRIVSVNTYSQVIIEGCLRLVSWYKSHPRSEASAQRGNDMIIKPLRRKAIHQCGESEHHPQEENTARNSHGQYGLIGTSAALPRRMKSKFVWRFLESTPLFQALWHSHALLRTLWVVQPHSYCQI